MTLRTISDRIGTLVRDEATSDFELLVRLQKILPGGCGREALVGETHIDCFSFADVESALSGFAQTKSEWSKFDSCIGGALHNALHSVKRSRLAGLRLVIVQFCYNWICFDSFVLMLLLLVLGCCCRLY